MKKFNEKYPDAVAEFVAPPGDFSLPAFIELIQQVVATKPDGIAVPILNAEAHR